MRKPDVLKLLLGLGLPYVGVIGLLPWAASEDIYVFGIPFIYAWVFVWFILTSGCLMLCWILFDRRSETRNP